MVKIFKVLASYSEVSDLLRISNNNYDQVDPEKVEIQFCLLGKKCIVAGKSYKSYPTDKESVVSTSCQLIIK